MNELEQLRERLAREARERSATGFSVWGRESQQELEALDALLSERDLLRGRLAQLERTHDALVVDRANWRKRAEMCSGAIDAFQHQRDEDRATIAKLRRELGESLGRTS